MQQGDLAFKKGFHVIMLTEKKLINFQNGSAKVESYTYYQRN
jgi:hypothetical protein